MSVRECENKKAPKGALSYWRKVAKESAGHRENCRSHRFMQIDENHAGCPAGAFRPGLDVSKEGATQCADKEKAPGGAWWGSGGLRNGWYI